MKLLYPQKRYLVKWLSLFSVVRAYNIWVIAVAQYLSAIFILSSERRALDVLLDFRLLLLVVASSLSIASGYIVNNFYDREKDLINRPQKYYLDKQLSQYTMWRTYFLLNFLSAGLAFCVSWRAALFFSAYIFSIWLYSHKLKRIILIGNFTAAVLAVLPFFSILMYFKNFYTVIFIHACFLFLLVFIRELIKDLENVQGDLAANYQTLPVLLGNRFSKWLITFCVVFTLIPVYLLLQNKGIGEMKYYFIICSGVLLLFLVALWRATSKVDFVRLHFLLKSLIVAGVFCIVLINPLVIVHGKKWLFF